MKPAVKNHPARCFAIIDTGTGQPTRCKAVVAWRGLVRSADGATHHVLSCEKHVEHVEGSAPFSGNVEASGAASDRVVMLR